MSTVKRNLFFSLFIVQLFVVWAIDDGGPVVSSNQGFLRGIYMTTRGGRRFSAFLGIPFAKPPLNELRFKPPVSTDPWEGIKNATEIHAICPQRDIYRRTSLIEGEEDCLYLNVYTPQLPSDGSDPLPVMVFFHGGGWLCGGGNSLWYGPSILLDRDVLLVVTNYRLGALGFLSTGDEVSPGNNGMKDQTLALKWIKNNIVNFGGDSQRITIFGESAGGASAQYHMLSPMSRGLFHGAVSQSGTAQCSWTLAPKDQAVRNAKKLAAALNCPTEPSKDLVNCLSKVDAYKIIEQDQIFMEWDFDPMIPFKPVIEPDLEDAFLTEHPIDMIKAGKTAQVPWIVGLNTEDGALRVADRQPDEADKRTAEIMTTLWANFAQTGNPTPDIGEVIEEKWNPVKSEDMEYYYIDADNTKMKQGLFLERAKFWRTLATHSRKVIVKDEL